jgi:chemotaxis protein methyltransferase CheR
MAMNTGIDLLSIQLSDKQFEKIRQTLYQLCGINLQNGKEELVKARLSKRLRKMGFRTFEEYIEFVESDRTGDEIKTMIDLLTTNKTSFFREQQHFDFLRNHILPPLKANRGRLRIWSAGCSSGEEPFSIAILLREEIPDIDLRDVRILATDISQRMLEKASTAIYRQDTLADVPLPVVNKYFARLKENDGTSYKVRDNVADLIRFARLNLMEAWPMKGLFDVIFCRNVMIYFDKTTQQELVNRFWHFVKKGGHLFVGHSESMAALSHPFRYIQPAVYSKP